MCTEQLSSFSKKLVADLDDEVLNDLKYTCPFCDCECTQKPVRGKNGVQGFCISCKKSFYLD